MSSMTEGGEPSGSKTVKWTASMEAAYEVALETIGGLDAAKPKAVHDLLAPQFPQLSVANCKWKLLAHRRRLERHREMVPAGIAPPTKWTGRLEEAYEEEVARQGGLHAARPKAVFDALVPHFPELTLPVVKWHLQGQRRRKQAELRKPQAGSSTGGDSEGGVTAPHSLLRAGSHDLSALTSQHAGSTPRRWHQQQAASGSQHAGQQPLALKDRLARGLQQEEQAEGGAAPPPKRHASEGLEAGVAQLANEREQLQRKLQAGLHAPAWQGYLLPAAEAALQRAAARRQKLSEVIVHLEAWARQLRDIMEPSLQQPTASWGPAGSDSLSGQQLAYGAGRQPSPNVMAGVERLLHTMHQRAEQEQVAAAAADRGSVDDGEAHLRKCSVPHCHRCVYERRLQERRQEQQRRLKERQQQLRLKERQQQLRQKMPRAQMSLLQAQQEGLL